MCHVLDCIRGKKIDKVCSFKHGTTKLQTVLLLRSTASTKALSFKCTRHCMRMALHRILITYLVVLNSELTFNAMPVLQHYTKTNSTPQTFTIININVKISYKNLTTCTCQMKLQMKDPCTIEHNDGCWFNKKNAFPTTCRRINLTAPLGYIILKKQKKKLVCVIY